MSDFTLADTDQQLAYAANPRRQRLKSSARSGRARLRRKVFGRRCGHRRTRWEKRSPPRKPGGKLRGTQRGPAAFTGYILAHEVHHRGQIILHLKYARTPVDPALGYSTWDWEKISPG